MDDDIALPEGRLHIVCKPSEDAGEMELPMRLLFVGDFKGRDERPLEERLPVRFDRDTFGKVLAAHAPRLDVTVTSADAHTVRATLGFRSLADFGPDAIAEQIPEVQRLLSVRDALTDLKSTGDVGAFRAALGALSLGPAEHARLLASLGLEGA